MDDFLDVLAKDAMRTINEGYYEIGDKASVSTRSLRQTIEGCKLNPVIAEIKTISPSLGTIRTGIDPLELARTMELAGAVGISVLTEPRHFGGDLDTIWKIRGKVCIPILMKDIILSQVQIDAASRTGADAVLLIQAIFDRGYSEKDIQNMIDFAHSKNLEVLLEVHTEEELLSALKTSADMIGINNRDLRTLKVDLAVTERILKKDPSKSHLFVSESGISSPEDIRFLRACGIQAFLVGTAIMKASKVEEKVKELVEAL